MSLYVMVTVRVFVTHTDGKSFGNDKADGL